MPDIEIYNNDKEALFQGVRLIILSGLSLVLNKEKDCDFKRHLSWVGYTPLVEVNQAILAWSFQTMGTRMPNHIILHLLPRGPSLLYFMLLYTEIYFTALSIFLQPKNIIQMLGSSRKQSFFVTSNCYRENYCPLLAQQVAPPSGKHAWFASELHCMSSECFQVKAGFHQPLRMFQHFRATTSYLQKYINQAGSAWSVQTITHSKAWVNESDRC